MAVDATFDHKQEDALERLRDEYAAGALSLEELTKRIGRAYAATTSAELDDVVADLSSFPAVPPAGSEMVEPHLVHGEHVLWVGRPDPARHFSKGDRVAIPFSLLWGGFAIFWEASVIVSGGGFFVLWGIPFVALGLYMMVGRFFYKARLKRRTWFAVTNRRVIKLERRRTGDAVDAAFIDAIPAVNRDVGADGAGSVVFGGGTRWQAELASSGMPSFFMNNVQVPLAFYDVPDAARVADLVTELRQERPER
jgi:Domain of unknown function (DUF1707)